MKNITSKIIYKEIINYCNNEKGKWKFQLGFVCKQWFNILKKLVNEFYVDNLNSLIYLEKRLKIIYQQQEGQKKLDRFNIYNSSNMITFSHRNNYYYSILNGINKIIFKDLDKNLIENNNDENQKELNQMNQLNESIRELINKITSIDEIKFIYSDKYFIQLKPSNNYMKSLKIKSSNNINFPLEVLAESLNNSKNLQSVSLISFCYCSNLMVFLNALFKSNVENFNLKINGHGNVLIDHQLEKNFSSLKISGAIFYLQRFNDILNQTTIEEINSQLYLQDNEPIENIERFCENIKNNKTIKKLTLSGNYMGLPQSSTLSKMFSNVFKFNKSITSLCISKLNILSEGFFESLMNHPTITQLELIDGSLDEQLLISLSNLLTTSPKTKIEYLSIKNNNLSDINSSIYQILLNNKSLKGIDLSNNNFTIHQMGKMFEALSENDNIYKLDLSNSCKLSSNHSIKPLNDYINNSKKLLAINLYNCLINSPIQQSNQLLQLSLEEKQDNFTKLNNDLILFCKKFNYKTSFIV